VPDRPGSAFGYDEAVLARFPTVRAGIVTVRGTRNGPSPAELVEAFEQEVARAADELAGTAIADLPSIAAWRRVFSAFGVSPTRYRNAAEALLRRATKKGGVPSVNLLVDVGNLLSIRHRLPLAVIDADRVSGAVTVRVATGAERFADLGGTEADHPEPGEIVMVDDAGEVVTRRWCWRQSTRSGITEATGNVLIAVEGHHDGADADVDATLAGFEDLLGRYLPGAEVISTRCPASR